MGVPFRIKSKAFNGLPYKNLDKSSIGIEVCNWGMLKEKDGKFYNYVNRIVDSSEVTELDNPFKGHKFWHKYTDKQIDSLKILLYICVTSTTLVMNIMTTFGV